MAGSTGGGSGVLSLGCFVICRCSSAFANRTSDAALLEKEEAIS